MLETVKKQGAKGKDKGSKGKGQENKDKTTPRKKDSNPSKRDDGKKTKKLKVRLKPEPEFFEEEERDTKPVLIFPGLLNEATRLSLSSPLREALEAIYIDLAHVPEQTIQNIRQEFEEILPEILKKLTKVRSYLKFRKPVLPDFTGNDVITDGDLDILLPFKPPTYSEEHLEPGYMTVAVGGGKRRDLDDDKASAFDTFKAHLTTDSVHVSPMNVCRILYEGFCPPLPKKKKGKNKKKSETESPVCHTPSIEDIEIDEKGIKDGHTSVASCLKDVPNNKTFTIHSPRDRAPSQVTNRSSGTPRPVDDDVAMFDGNRQGDDEISEDKRDGTRSRNSRQSTSRNSGKKTPSEKTFQLNGSRPPSESRSRHPSTTSAESGELQNEGEKVSEKKETTEIEGPSSSTLNVQPFVVDDLGARVMVVYGSLRIRLVPCLAVRPGDEVAEHDFLVSKPFEHDENPQSHMLWRQSCLIRERVITRSMSRADGGVRIKALRTMTSLAKIDPGLEGLTPYIIKTAFLHNFDHTIDVTPRWQRNTIENCFIPLLKDLSSAFNSRRLQHFFLKDFNILDGIHPTVYARIRSRLALLASSDAALIRALKRR